MDKYNVTKKKIIIFEKMIYTLKYLITLYLYSKESGREKGRQYFFFISGLARRTALRCFRKS